MTSPASPPWPVLLADLPEHDSQPEEDEIAALQAVRSADIPVAPIVVVPAEVEERFYRLNNLPDRLSTLFVGVDPNDPDEDDLEERAPAAMALIEKHFLLDELIDAFYDRIMELPSRVRVRRTGRSGIESGRGRPALLGLKRIWARDWSFEALAARLGRHGTFAIEARPVLVHAQDVPASPGLAARVRASLNSEFEVWATPDGEVTRSISRGARESVPGSTW